jgi:hypothetical protein
MDEATAAGGTAGPTRSSAADAVKATPADRVLPTDLPRVRREWQEEPVHDEYSPPFRPIPDC